MSDERFTVIEHIDEDDCLNSYRLIQDNETGMCYGSFTKICKLLNRLAEENRRSKRTLIDIYKEHHND